MTVAVVIISAVFALILAGLSIRANARFRKEQRLPMQWMISRSAPLSETVIKSAPRVFALAFIPSLGICALVLLSVGAMTLTPRPGQEGLLLPSALMLGGLFVAAHVFYLWLVDRTLGGNGN